MKRVQHRLKYQKNRPGDVAPNGLIIHSMAEYVDDGSEVRYAPDFLDHALVSAHYMVAPDGTILECVDPLHEAFHAGKSRLGDEEWLNKTFIGIEMLVQGTYNYATFLARIKQPDCYTPEQVSACAKLALELVMRFAIPEERLVRHSDVSGPEVRSDPKHDPGPAFDFDALKHQIYYADDLHEQLMREHT